MFHNLSIKTRFYIFIVGIFLVLIISYKLSIKATVMCFVENNKLSGQLDSVKQGSVQLNLLKAKLDKIKNCIGSTNNPNTDIHQEILNTCSKFCTENNLLIREYPEKEVLELGRSKSEINKITIDGSFNKALRLLYLCERTHSFGRMVAVQFEKQKDIYAQKERLFTTIYFQNIVSE